MPIATETRAADPSRIVGRVLDVLVRALSVSQPIEPPSLERLREMAVHKRYLAAAPHFLSVGGLIDIIRIPR